MWLLSLRCSIINEYFHDNRERRWAGHYLTFGSFLRRTVPLARRLSIHRRASRFFVPLSHVPRLVLSRLSSRPSGEYGSDESWNFRLIRHANDGVVQHPVASTNTYATIPPLSTFCRNLLADLHNNGHAPANSKLAERIR